VENEAQIDFAHTSRRGSTEGGRLTYPLLREKTSPREGLACCVDKIVGAKKSSRKRRGEKEEKHQRKTHFSLL